MTREEAIKVLQRMKYPYKCNKRKMIISNVDRDNEALDMAMQALSQEPICDRDCEHCTWTECPIEPCDDAVSRDAAITIAGTHTLTVDETVKALEQLPSVTQKSGTWHRKHDSIVNDWFWECDKCGCGYQHEYNYCPNCGARMESEE